MPAEVCAMNEDGRFEILVYPENGDGVNAQTNKLAQRDIDGIDLVIREVPHVESAIELLIDGHADMAAVSAKWWYENRQDNLTASIVLPRREPTKVLVCEDKVEYLPKNGIVLADCELSKRQMLRARPDVKTMLASELEDLPDKIIDRLSWMEDKRNSGEIDGYIISRSLYSLLPSRTRRHTLGLQRDNVERFRFIPTPLEGYTVFITRMDFPAHNLLEIIDAGAAISLRIEMMILDHIDNDKHEKIGMYVEQRKVGTVLREADKKGDGHSRDSIVSMKGDVKGDSRIDMILETLDKSGKVTASIEKVFPPEEIHTSSLVLVKNWNTLIQILSEIPEEEKRSRIKEMMDKYTEDMVSEGRISADKIGLPKFNDY